MEDTTPQTQPPDETHGDVMPTVPAHTLNAALLAARAAVSARVFKANSNQHQKYTYVSHEHVLTHARDALLAHGLILEQRSVVRDGILSVAHARGESQVWCWTGTFALVHERGEERLYQFAATTQPNDKAAFAASTNLDKLAYMRLLALAGTDDENAEADWHDNQPGGAAQQNAPGRPLGGQGGRRQAPSNVVTLRQPEPGVPDAWKAGLATMQANLQKLTEPDALVSWWVDLTVALPQLQQEPARKRAAWAMYQAHLLELGMDVPEFKAEIDKRILAKKNGGAS